jgi:hypothetical protein
MAQSLFGGVKVFYPEWNIIELEIGCKKISLP